MPCESHEDILLADDEADEKCPVCLQRYALAFYPNWNQLTVDLAGRVKDYLATVKYR